MSKPKIYLAGKMSSLTFEEMNEWRIDATNQFKEYSNNIHIENPCNFYNFEIDPSTFTDKECKEFDLWLVKNSDIILVNLDYPNSIGTAIELECASRFWNKPVIGFGTTINHPWIEQCLTKKCKTIKEAIEHIITFYLSNI